MLGRSRIGHGLVASMLATCAIALAAAPAEAGMPGPSKEAVVALVDAQIPGDVVSSDVTAQCSIVYLPYFLVIQQTLQGVWYFFARPFGISYERYIKALNVGAWRLC